MITLHDYQQKAYDLLVEAFKSSSRALVVMATGLGKTIVAAFWAKGELKKKRKGLFLCHDNGILDQAIVEFRKVLGNQVSLKAFYGNESEKDFDAENADIAFASFQSLCDWKKAFLENAFDFIIVDESHHGQAPTYKEVIQYFKPKKLLGITATPDRTDMQDIREIFGNEVVEYTLEESIANGWLTKVEYRLYSDNLNRFALNKLFQEIISDTNKRVSMKQLNETLFIEMRDEEVAKIILAENKKTIIFCENIKHCENFARYIPGGYAYHSERTQEDNARAMEQFKSNGLQYILSVNKFNEGIDVPDAGLIVFLRATDSRTVFLQQLGRGLRNFEGKEKVIIMDFVANCERLVFIKEFVDRIKQIAKRELVKDVMHVSGKFFDFIFTREDLDIFEVIGRVMQKRTVADMPHLADEYMPPPKNSLPADQVTAGTNNKLWWKCSKEDCGHEWCTGGNHRVLGTGCPACSGRITTIRSSLATTHPELAREYMPQPKNQLPANKVAAGTNTKVWWKCSKEDCGHEWQAVGSSRAKGTGCPACANQVATIKNNLAVIRPYLAREYMLPPKNELPATEVIAGTGKKLWWKCSREGCGHEWEATGDCRVYSGTGCPACANITVTNRNNLTVTHPELSREYMPPPRNELPADQIIAGTGKKHWWKCSKESCRHEWEASGDGRSQGAGCPACGNRVATSNNNLTVTHPELAKEYMPPPKNQLPAIEVTAGIGKKIWWKCFKEGCGHEWEATGDSRVQGTGCPACLGRVATKKNNLTLTHPDLAKEYIPPPKNELPATEVIAGTGKKLWWKCSREGCGHEWEASGNNRVQGRGCPACANRVVTDWNNLALTHPELAKEYMSPPKNSLPVNRIVAGTNGKIWWKCSKQGCGHEWEATGDSRVRGRGCPACHKKMKKRK